MNLLPEQCRAARGLLNWTQEHLATVAGVSRSTIKDFECNRHAIHRATEALLIRAFEEGGVRLIPAQGEGPGVRLSCRYDNAQPNTIN
ncbi:helix-turn-helix domain-containing protein [Kaistia terrae]|uniref:Multiprotein-bridging factor 1 family protein n=1 Tax=Kaistia terrae TaxID=537017 RepID=A0ABW0PY28_9HYPH|nr:helix-turn-helix transcriptional regulator [Kaistia terrae]MCX5579287.1 helix-turn-helix transcriptional regulator [Kaistia terrae]